MLIVSLISIPRKIIINMIIKKTSGKDWRWCCRHQARWMRSRGHHLILCCSSLLVQQTVGCHHHAFVASILLYTQPHPASHLLALAVAAAARWRPLQQLARRQGECRLRPVHPSAVDEAGLAPGLMDRRRHWPIADHSTMTTVWKCTQQRIAHHAVTASA